MKNSITILLALLCYALSFSQNNTINYKALVRDGNGNLVNNQSISVQLAIQTSFGSTLYQETHSITTDTNGIAILDIGSVATPDVGVYEDINWKLNNFLNVRIDITGGTNFVDMGTTEFKSVPYALHALNAVGSLQRIEQSNGQFPAPDGWILDDGLWLNGGFIINPGQYSIDMMLHEDVIPFEPLGSNNQATGVSGLSSFSAGRDNAVLGNFAVSFGFRNASQGNGSALFGVSNSALGDYALLHGSGNQTDGDYITALGQGLNVNAFHSLVMGRFNVGGGDTSTWVDTDPIFEIGNGSDDSNRSNSLTILKNGTITAPSLTNALIDAAGDKALVTKEYALNTISALKRVEHFNGLGFPDPDGWILDKNGMWHDGGYTIDPGSNSIDMMLHADVVEQNVWGSFIGVPGVNSFSAGRDNLVLGNSSVGFGNKNASQGEGSAMFGVDNWAFGDYALLHGRENRTNGDYITALGRGLNADAFHSIVMGRFNVGGGDTSAWVDTDPILEIGNGSDDSNRSNSLTILKNGTITAPSLTNALIDVAGDKAFITKEYALNAIGSNGLKRIDNGGFPNPPGWILDNGGFLDGGFIIGPGNNSIDMMLHNDLLNSDGNFSQGTGVSGTNSFAAGYDNAVLGSSAVSFGSFNAVEGTGSAMFGFNNWSFGDYSLVHGNTNRTTGDYITALGSNLNADAFHSVVLGRYNVGGGSNSGWSLDDPIFEIGTGSSDSDRSNAITVLKSGKTIVYEKSIDFDGHAINGIQSHTGDVDSSGVYGENTVSDFFGIGVQGQAGYIGTFGEVNPSGDFTYIGAYGRVVSTHTGTGYGVFGVASGGTTNYAIYANGNLAHTGAIINASDRKLKTNINALPNALESILRLKPKSYSIAPQYVKSMNMSNKPQFGFIAQELQDVFPELVSSNEHPGATKQDAPIEYLGVNYTSLIPVLTAAMQEQQQQIESQQAVIESLISRIEALENK